MDDLTHKGLTLETVGTIDKVSSSVRTSTSDGDFAPLRLSIRQIVPGTASKPQGSVWVVEVGLYRCLSSAPSSSVLYAKSSYL